MSYLDVYIGYLDDPDFHWDGGNWSGNVPQRESSFFPSGHNAFHALIDRIQNGVFEGKQTDFDGWVAKATKQQIIEFIDECCADEDVEELREFVETLDEGTTYALVAAGL